MLRKSNSHLLETALGTVALEDNQHLYYIEPLGKFSRGYEINYVGQGMYYNHALLWTKANCYGTPYAWKGALMSIEKLTGMRLGSRPYDWPTRDEKFFTKYGFEHYNKD